MLYRDMMMPKKTEREKDEKMASNRREKMCREGSKREGKGGGNGGAGEEYKNLQSNFSRLLLFSSLHSTVSTELNVSLHSPQFHQD